MEIPLDESTHEAALRMAQLRVGELVARIETRDCEENGARRTLDEIRQRLGRNTVTPVTE